jgi:hypothetical protein
MTLREMVTIPSLIHHRRSLSFVAAHPTRTSLLPGTQGFPDAKSICCSSVGGDFGSDSDSMFGSEVAVLRSSIDIKIWPSLPKMGDHECPITNIRSCSNRYGRICLLYPEHLTLISFSLAYLTIDCMSAVVPGIQVKKGVF